ncbi:hypothetical protein [Actinomyces glycerinitolerans]|uniref:Uncharacterized protein n=1 Tax=Actinomyces glycerinitolerans TaxID=1892869 RepID=A0A1M4S0S7_9ACTO|nr:hypothetical protein [Actinomyces glycerinitolerans]SHE25833.1 Hypothetical protein ACGLYG10_2069 [Actinomyces glycerinitolerans]
MSQPQAPRSAGPAMPDFFTAGADLAITLPDTTLSAVGSFPVGRADSQHLLLLADDVTVDEVEALALSLDEHAGWVGASRLQVAPGAELQGPWHVDGELRRVLELPDWASQVMVLDCPPQRAGALPQELVGVDPLTDAFPLAQPTGTELLALIRLRAIARRLAGGIRLAGDPAAPGGRTRPVLVVPDPERSTTLTVYSPVWIVPDGVVALTAPVAPGAHVLLQPDSTPGPTGLASIPPEELDRLVETLGEDALDAAWRAAEQHRHEQAEQEAQALAAGIPVEELRDGYGVVTDVAEERPDWGGIEIRVQAAEAVPLAVRGESWARGGVIAYQVVWAPLDPADAHHEYPPTDVRRARDAAGALIEKIAATLLGGAGGVVVDDDGFLVAL